MLVKGDPVRLYFEKKTTKRLADLGNILNEKKILFYLMMQLLAHDLILTPTANAFTQKQQTDLLNYS